MENPDEVRQLLMELRDLQRATLKTQKTIAMIGWFLAFVGVGICAIFLTELGLLVFLVGGKL